MLCFTLDPRLIYGNLYSSTGLPHMVCLPLMLVMLLSVFLPPLFSLSLLLPSSVSVFHLLGHPVGFQSGIFLLLHA
jgi:hypothetical protein